MSLFKKSKPELPPIENEEQVIEWLLRYSKDDVFKFLRKRYKHGFDKIIKVTIPFIMKELKDYPTGNALMVRAGDIATTYQDTFQPLIEARGGLRFCPDELLNGIIQVQIKIAILLYFLKYKYNISIPDDLLGMTKIYE